MARVDTSTSILGMHCSLPVFASPAAMAGLGHPDGEKNIVKGVGKGGILYGVRCPLGRCERGEGAKL